MSLTYAAAPHQLPKRHFALWLTTDDSHLRPDEVGTPWADRRPLVGYFTGAHQDHLHLAHY